MNTSGTKQLIHSHSHQRFTGTQVLCNLCHTHKGRDYCSKYKLTIKTIFVFPPPFQSVVPCFFSLTHPDAACVTQEIFYSAESIPIRTFRLRIFLPVLFHVNLGKGVFLPRGNSESLMFPGSDRNLMTQVQRGGGRAAVGTPARLWLPASTCLPASDYIFLLSCLFS